MADTAQLGYLAIGKQTAKGVPATTDLLTQMLLHSSHSLGVEASVEDPDPEIGGSREPALGSAIFSGTKVTGDLDASLRFTLLPLLLLGAGYVESGAPVEQGSGSGAYRHRFIPGTAAPLTLQSSYGLARLVRQWQDVLVDSLELAVEAEGEGTISASFLGTREVVIPSPIATAAPAVDAKAIWYGSAVQLGGLGTYRWTSTSLAIENNLDDGDYVLGQRALGDITPGNRTVTVSGKVSIGDNNPDVMALYRAAAYGSPTATEAGTLEPYQTTGAVTIGSAKLIGTSTTERFRCVATLPGLVLQPFPLEQSGADKLEVTIEARQYGAGYTIDVYNARSTVY